MDGAIYEMLWLWLLTTPKLVFGALLSSLPWTPSMMPQSPPVPETQSSTPQSQPQAPQPPTPPPAAALVAPLAKGNKRQLVVVMLDGSRWDYLELMSEREIGGFRFFKDGGVRVEYVESVFPSVTYPAWTTLGTGLHPESHDVLGNSMYDRDTQLEFNASSTQLPIWWQEAEPIWATVTLQGLRAATIEWNRADVPYRGILPEVAKGYTNSKRDFSDRIEEVIWRLRQGFDLIMMYYERIDTMGHHFGPASEEVFRELRVVGRGFDRLFNFATRGDGRAGDVHVLVVADHGMAPACALPPLNVSRYADVRSDAEKVVCEGASAAIYAKPGRRRKLLEQLKDAPGYVTRLREDIPLEFHYREAHRAPDLLMFGLPVSWNESACPLRGGVHGFDPTRVPDMRSLFLGWGSAFSGPGLVHPPLHLVDIYQLYAYLLKVQPRPHNGSWEAVRGMLHPEGETRDPLGLLGEAPEVPLPVNDAGPARREGAPGGATDSDSPVGDGAQTDASQRGVARLAQNGDLNFQTPNNHDSKSFPDGAKAETGLQENSQINDAQMKQKGDNKWVDHIYNPNSNLNGFFYNTQPSDSSLEKMSVKNAQGKTTGKIPLQGYLSSIQNAFHHGVGKIQSIPIRFSPNSQISRDIDYNTYRSTVGLSENKNTRLKDDSGGKVEVKSAEKWKSLNMKLPLFYESAYSTIPPEYAASPLMAIHTMEEAGNGVRRPVREFKATVNTDGEIEDPNLEIVPKERENRQKLLQNYNLKLHNKNDVNTVRKRMIVQDLLNVRSFRNRVNHLDKYEFDQLRTFRNTRRHRARHHPDKNNYDQNYLRTQLPDMLTSQQKYEYIQRQKVGEPIWKYESHLHDTSNYKYLPSDISRIQDMSWPSGNINQLKRDPNNGEHSHVHYEKVRKKRDTVLQSNENPPSATERGTQLRKIYNNLIFHNPTALSVHKQTHFPTDLAMIVSGDEEKSGSSMSTSECSHGSTSTVSVSMVTDSREFGKRVTKTVISLKPGYESLFNLRPKKKTRGNNNDSAHPNVQYITSHVASVDVPVEGNGKEYNFIIQKTSVKLTNFDKAEAIPGSNIVRAEYKRAKGKDGYVEDNELKDKSLAHSRESTSKIKRAGRESTNARLDTAWRSSSKKTPQIDATSTDSKEEVDNEEFEDDKSEDVKETSSATSRKQSRAKSRQTTTLTTPEEKHHSHKTTSGEEEVTDQADSLADAEEDTTLSTEETLEERTENLVSTTTKKNKITTSTSSVADLSDEEEEEADRTNTSAHVSGDASVEQENVNRKNRIGLVSKSTMESELTSNALRLTEESTRYSPTIFEKFIDSHTRSTELITTDVERLVSSPSTSRNVESTEEEKTKEEEDNDSDDVLREERFASTFLNTRGIKSFSENRITREYVSNWEEHSQITNSFKSKLKRGVEHDPADNGEDMDYFQDRAIAVHDENAYDFGVSSITNSLLGTDNYVNYNSAETNGELGDKNDALEHIFTKVMKPRVVSFKRDKLSSHSVQNKGYILEPERSELEQHSGLLQYDDNKVLHGSNEVPTTLSLFLDPTRHRDISHHYGFHEDIENLKSKKLSSLDNRMTDGIAKEMKNDVSEAESLNGPYSQVIKDAFLEREGVTKIHTVNHLKKLGYNHDSDSYKFERDQNSNDEITTFPSFLSPTKSISHLFLMNSSTEGYRGDTKYTKQDNLQLLKNPSNEETGREMKNSESKIENVKTSDSGHAEESLYKKKVTHGEILAINHQKDLAHPPDSRGLTLLQGHNPNVVPAFLGRTRGISHHIGTEPSTQALKEDANFKSSDSASLKTLIEGEGYKKDIKDNASKAENVNNPDSRLMKEALHRRRLLITATPTIFGGEKIIDLKSRLDEFEGETPSTKGSHTTKKRDSSQQLSNSYSSEFYDDPELQQASADSHLSDDSENHSNDFKDSLNIECGKHRECTQSRINAIKLEHFRNEYNEDPAENSFSSTREAKEYAHTRKSPEKMYKSKSMFDEDKNPENLREKNEEYPPQTEMEDDDKLYYTKAPYNKHGSKTWTFESSENLQDSKIKSNEDLGLKHRSHSDVNFLSTLHPERFANNRYSPGIDYAQNIQIVPYTQAPQHTENLDETQTKRITLRLSGGQRSKILRDEESSEYERKHEYPSDGEIQPSESSDSEEMDDEQTSTRRTRSTHRLDLRERIQSRTSSNPEDFSSLREDEQRFTNIFTDFNYNEMANMKTFIGRRNIEKEYKNLREKINPADNPVIPQQYRREDENENIEDVIKRMRDKNNGQFDKAASDHYFLNFKKSPEQGINKQFEKEHSEDEWSIDTSRENTFERRPNSMKFSKGESIMELLDSSAAIPMSRSAVTEVIKYIVNNCNNNPFDRKDHNNEIKGILRPIQDIILQENKMSNCSSNDGSCVPQKLENVKSKAEFVRTRVTDRSRKVMQKERDLKSRFIFKLHNFLNPNERMFDIPSSERRLPTGRDLDSSIVSSTLSYTMNWLSTSAMKKMESQNRNSPRMSLDMLVRENLMGNNPNYLQNSSWGMTNQNVESNLNKLRELINKLSGTEKENQRGVYYNYPYVVYTEHPMEFSKQTSAVQKEKYSGEKEQISHNRKHYKDKMLHTDKGNYTFDIRAKDYQNDEDDSTNVNRGTADDTQIEDHAASSVDSRSRGKATGRSNAEKLEYNRKMGRTMDVGDLDEHSKEKNVEMFTKLKKNYKSKDSSLAIDDVATRAFSTRRSQKKHVGYRKGSLITSATKPTEENRLAITINFPDDDGAGEEITVPNPPNEFRLKKETNFDLPKKILESQYLFPDAKPMKSVHRNNVGFAHNKGVGRNDKSGHLYGVSSAKNSEFNLSAYGTSQLYFNGGNNGLHSRDERWDTGSEAQNILSGTALYSKEDLQRISNPVLKRDYVMPSPCKNEAIFDDTDYNESLVQDSVPDLYFPSNAKRAMSEVKTKNAKTIDPLVESLVKSPDSLTEGGSLSGRASQSRVDKVSDSLANKAKASLVGKTCDLRPDRSTDSLVGKVTDSLVGEATDSANGESTSSLICEDTDSFVNEATDAVNGGVTDSRVGESADSVVGVITDSTVGSYTDSLVSEATDSLVGAATNLLVGATTNSLVGEGTDSLVGEGTDSLIGEGTDSLVGEGTDSLIGEATVSLVGEATDSPVGEATDSLIGAASDSLVGEATDSVVEETPSSLVREAPESLIGETTDSLIYDATDSLTDEATDSFFSGGIASLVGQVTNSLVGKATNSPVVKSLNSFLGKVPEALVNKATIFLVYTTPKLPDNKEPILLVDDAAESPLDRDSVSVIRDSSNSLIDESSKSFDKKTSESLIHKDSELHSRKESASITKNEHEPLLYKISESPTNKESQYNHNIKVPVSLINKIPELIINKMPESFTNKSPESVVNKAPVSVINKNPDSAMNKVPETVIKNVPESIFNKAPNSFINKAPDSLLNKAPESIINKESESINNKTPESIINKSPETTINKTPDSIFNKDHQSIINKSPESIHKTTESNMNKNPETIINKSTEAILNKVPDSIINKVLETVIRKIPESIINKSPEFDISKIPESVIDKATESDMKKSPESDVNSSPESDINKSPDTVINKLPECVAHRIPESVFNKVPESVNHKTPESSIKGSPVSIVHKTPESVINKDPESVINKAPEPVVNKDSESIINIDPESVINKAHESVINKAPESVINKAPESVIYKAPESVINKTPESVIYRAPESVINKAPESIIKKASESVINKSPESVISKAPESVIYRAPESVISKAPVSVINKTPESIINKVPESIINKVPESVINKAPESVINKIPEYVINKAPESITNKAPESVINKTPESIINRSPMSVINKAPKSVTYNASDSVVHKESDSVFNKVPESVVNKQPESYVNKIPGSVIGKSSVIDKTPRYHTKKAPESFVKKAHDSLINKAPGSLIDNVSVSLINKSPEFLISKVPNSFMNVPPENVINKPSESLIGKGPGSLSNKVSDSLVNNASESLVNKVPQPLNDKVLKPKFVVSKAFDTPIVQAPDSFVRKTPKPLSDRESSSLIGKTPDSFENKASESPPTKIPEFTTTDSDHIIRVAYAPSKKQADMISGKKFSIKKYSRVTSRDEPRSNPSDPVRGDRQPYSKQLYPRVTSPAPHGSAGAINDERKAYLEARAAFTRAWDRHFEAARVERGARRQRNALASIAASRAARTPLSPLHPAAMRPLSSCM